MFTFSGSQNDFVVFTLSRTGGWSAFAGPQVTVFTPSGASLTTFNGNGRQGHVLPATGTYVLRVAASDLGTTGAYNLGIEAGQLYEHSATFPVESGGTETAELRAALRGWYAQEKTAVINGLQAQLRYFGHTESEA